MSNKERDERMRGKWAKRIGTAGKAVGAGAVGASGFFGARGEKRVAVPQGRIDDEGQVLIATIQAIGMIQHGALIEYDTSEIRKLLEDAAPLFETCLGQIQKDLADRPEAEQEIITHYRARTLTPEMLMDEKTVKARQTFGGAGGAVLDKIAQEHGGLGLLGLGAPPVAEDKREVLTLLESEDHVKRHLEQITAMRQSLRDLEKEGSVVVSIPLHASSALTDLRRRLDALRQKSGSED